jgi:hypothetical protein
MDAYHVSGTNQIKSKASLRLLSRPLVLSRVLISPSWKSFFLEEKKIARALTKLVAAFDFTFVN